MNPTHPIQQMFEALSQLVTPRNVNDMTVEVGDWSVLHINALPDGRKVFGFIELTHNGRRVLTCRLENESADYRRAYAVDFTGYTKHDIDMANAVLTFFDAQRLVAPADVTASSNQLAFDRLLTRLSGFAEAREFYPDDSPAPSVEDAWLAHDMLCLFEENVHLRDMWQHEERPYWRSASTMPFEAFTKALDIAELILERGATTQPIDAQMHDLLAVWRLTRTQ